MTATAEPARKRGTQKLSFAAPILAVLKTDRSPHLGNPVVRRLGLSCHAGDQQVKPARPVVPGRMSHPDLVYKDRDPRIVCGHPAGNDLMAPHVVLQEPAGMPARWPEGRFCCTAGAQWSGRIRYPGHCGHHVERGTPEGDWRSARRLDQSDAIVHASW